MKEEEDWGASKSVVILLLELLFTLLKNEDLQELLLLIALVFTLSEKIKVQ